MKRIHAEVTLNQLVGLIGGWLIVYLSNPLFVKYSLTNEQIATTYSVMFFIWSYSRSFVIRLIFERMRND